MGKKKIKKPKEPKKIKHLKMFPTAVRNQLKFFGYLEVEDDIPEMVISFFYSQFDTKRDGKEKKRITVFYKIDDDSSPAAYMFANCEDPTRGVVTFLTIENDRNEILPYTFNFVTNNLSINYKNCTIRVCRIPERFKDSDRKLANFDLNYMYKGYKCNYGFYTNFKSDTLQFAEDDKLFNNEYKWQIVKSVNGQNYSENGIVNMKSFEKNLNSSSFRCSFNNSFSSLCFNTYFFLDKVPGTNIPSSDYANRKTVGFNKIIFMFSDDPNSNETILKFLKETLFLFKSRLNVSDELFYSRFGFAFNNYVNYKMTLVKNILIDL